MVSILYTLFIFPIEIFLKFVLETSLMVVESYGAALIVMSAVVSLILWPLYIIAERLQEKERMIRKKMQPHIDDLKSVYRGYDLHLYTKALYRQYNYHPLSSLRSSLGLLIQLPFFIAAYYFLSHYEALNGVGFGFINNLGLPDGVIRIAGLQLNLLPFVMTAFNLAGAYFYGRNLSRKDSIQMYVVAAIFFVLLYNAPSGLLIYWICNNIFSFTRYLILSFER